ncbi:HPr family phosphocarrier protein [Paenibacillus flagellatus]|uniref:Phosphocarrier protein HPr n=1 Tax=Paenibacillus flagellatus TaxID=2211139 RepID=A0A2V5K1B4_9BACL|nr:HPr family phosphocarrier protein [Paenibacillus flagellatus]PYI51504.1 HPr family phosphocarrier protein [Paenibacillus flagellatus]
MIVRTVTVQNEQGFHVRPAQLFVEKAGAFEARIRVRGGAGEADGKSMLELMTLGLEKGSALTIEADGPDEAEAVRTLAELVDGRFGEA